MVIPVVVPITETSIQLRYWAGVLFYIILAILIASAIVWAVCMVREILFDKDESKVTKWCGLVMIASLLSLMVFLFVVVAMGVGVAK